VVNSASRSEREDLFFFLQARAKVSDEKLLINSQHCMLLLLYSVLFYFVISKTFPMQSLSSSCDLHPFVSNRAEMKCPHRAVF